MRVSFFNSLWYIKNNVTAENRLIGSSMKIEKIPGAAKLYISRCIFSRNISKK